MRARRNVQSICRSRQVAANRSARSPTCSRSGASMPSGSTSVPYTSKPMKAMAVLQRARFAAGCSPFTRSWAIAPDPRRWRCIAHARQRRAWTPPCHSPDTDPGGRPRSLATASIPHYARSTMKAQLLERPNDPFRLVDVPRPTPRPGEVLVRIHASGVNPLDTKIHAGTASCPPSWGWISPASSRSWAMVS